MLWARRGSRPGSPEANGLDLAWAERLQASVAMQENPLFIQSYDPTARSRAFAEERKKHAAYFDDLLKGWIILDRRAIQSALRGGSEFSTRIYATGLLEKGLVAMGGEEHARL